MTILWGLSSIAAVATMQSVAVIKPTPRIGIRVFKREEVLEVWGSEAEDKPFHRLGRFKIAMMSGTLGPKRKEGDLQVPEGFYWIDRFNPKSRFHLSLGLNYPNESDRILGDPHSPGSDIFIHGSNVSVGCMAMTDPVIDVIYPLATHARDCGQIHIPVQIFPCKMTAKNMAALRVEYADQPKLLAFWEGLRPGYDAFEAHRIWLEPKVGPVGAYVWPK